MRAQGVLVRALPLTAAAILWVSSASATVLTFPATTIDPITNYTESGFTLQDTPGSIWKINGSIGNPAGALSTGAVVPPVGSELDLFLTAGGMFTFTQFEANTVASTDHFSIIGEVGGVTTQQLLDFGGINTNNAFQSFSTGFTAPVDRVRLIITSVGGRATFVDNLTVNAVPEPASFTSALLGFGAILWAARKWRRA